MLSIVTLNESQKWDEIVKSFSNYDVYYLSSYVKGFKIHGDGEPRLFYYRDDNIKAMNVVMKRDISLDKRFVGKIPPNTYYDIATPYGYGGFLIEGHIVDKSLKTLFQEYTFLCKQKRIISEFVRFHPVLKNGDILKFFYDVISIGKTITLNLNSREHIWSNLESKNRNKIRKAIKSGVEIFWGRSPKLFEKFIELYNATMDKDNANDYYYFNKDFYNSILNDLKYNSLIFYAVLKGRIISMSLILYGNGKIHYHLSGSDREYLHFAPTNLLLYEVACWGSDNGFQTFHLGGGVGSEEDNLYKFKKVFNKNSNTLFSIGKKIFDKEKYGELFELRKQESDFDSESKYFPIYRA